MAFGTKQLNNPTPASINNISGAITAFLTAILTWLQTVDFIPSNAVKIITGICGGLILIMNALRPFFGHEVTGNVPSEAVTAVDTEKLEIDLKANEKV